MTEPELGLIEGYYGKTWSWEERAANVSFLARYGFRSYLYAPKADPWLRRRWSEPHPDREAREIERLAAHCRTHGVRFGVGLSLTNLELGLWVESKPALAEKLAALEALGIQDLAVLFDDMRGFPPSPSPSRTRTARATATERPPARPRSRC
jgi:hypothetical protein